MITLHTFENSYDDGDDYHQFLQRGRQHLLDSTAIGQGTTLRYFLEHSIIEDCLGPSSLEERAEARFRRLLNAVMASGDIPKLLSYAERIDRRDAPGQDPCRTRFGDWTFDSVVIDPPSLRELQDNMWGTDETFPKTDWCREVANDCTTLGYWEWVDHSREMAAGSPWKLGDHVTWTDPDDSICSRTGILKEVYCIGDGALHIVMEDGWEAEVHASELSRAE